MATMAVSALTGFVMNAIFSRGRAAVDAVARRSRATGACDERNGGGRIGRRMLLGRSLGVAASCSRSGSGTWSRTRWRPSCCRRRLPSSRALGKLVRSAAFWRDVGVSLIEFVAGYRASAASLGIVAGVADRRIARVRGSSRRRWWNRCASSCRSRGSRSPSCGSAPAGPARSCWSPMRCSSSWWCRRRGR